MSLTRYPYLAAIREELTRVAVAESARDTRRPRGVSIGPGRDLRPVLWPGLGRYLLTPPQTRVVEELLDALLHSASPEVDQLHLVRVSGARVSRLSEVFARSPAWGELVIPGERAGHYRLFAPPVEEGEGDGPDDAA